MTRNSTIRNIVSSIVLQIITAISGLILPHFFISFYGSTINGMVSSITQFLSYLALVEAGISASAVVELYGYLEKRDEQGRNYILSATKHFYFKSGILYLLLLLVLVLIYPQIIGDQVNRMTSVFMIAILAASNLIDYFVLGKYRVLLSADQRVYVLNNIQSIGTIFNIVVSVLLMFLEQDIILVKLAETVIYACRAIIVIIYVGHHYNNIQFGLETANDALPQRWNALFHQIVGVICNNTDIVLITICLGARSLAEASVYYVYNLVASMFTSLSNSISVAIIPTFGKMYASDREDELERLYDDFEFLFFILIFTLYSCMFLLLVPFVRIYTMNATDVEYVRRYLPGLFVIMGLVQNIRIPSLSMICAAGHYKQTQWRAFIEAVINLSVSLALIFKFGIAGAVIGTICSYTYRSTDSIFYCRRFFKNQTIKTTLVRLTRNVIIMLTLYTCINRNKINVVNWTSFFGNGTILFLVCFFSFAGINYAFERTRFQRHYAEIVQFLHRRGGV